MTDPRVDEVRVREVREANDARIEQEARDVGLQKAMYAGFWRARARGDFGHALMIANDAIAQRLGDTHHQRGLWHIRAETMAGKLDLTAREAQRMHTALLTP